MEETTSNKRKSGTKEWTDKSINCITGCQHNCLYCYQESTEVRFRGLDPKNWKNEVVRLKDLTKKIPKHKSMVMFPSSHDITPIHLTENITMLGNILKSGNSVLVVSKPHYECISKICEVFTEYKDKLLFRFTIGSMDSQVLKFWEPGGTTFEERLECLKLCYLQGYQTSVSMEPVLDKNVDGLVDILSLWVTETIWIGKPNHLLYRVRMNGHGDIETLQKCNELLGWINDPVFIKGLYLKYNVNPMIRFKESFRLDFEKLKLSSD